MKPISGKSTNIYSFFKSQVDQICSSGFCVFYRKIYTGLTQLSIFLFAPLVLFLRMLRPLVWIRFGMLISHRIGHFTSNTEYYLRKKKLCMNKRTFDLFCCSTPVSNKQLRKMYGRVIHISRFNKVLYRCNRMLPGYKDHEVPLKEWRDVENLKERTKPFVRFTPAEESLGDAAMRELGLPKGVPLIIFHARDSEYLNKTILKPTGNHWRYHDYRDSNINNYLAAAEALAERGYYALRMGAIVKEALDTTNPKIIDYATKHRTDFLDIYLSYKCHFVLGSPSGITHVAYDLFGKSMAWVNAVPLESMLTWNPRVMYIPKKYWLRDERRFMRFREIFESGVGRYTHTQEYEARGIDLIENTPEEINALAIEMDERLNGTWHTTREDSVLQEQFWSIFPKSRLHGRVIRSLIGAKFLRDNRELLN